MPPLACSKRPDAPAVGAGEGAALVPEELRFEQRLGQRRAVHLDERAAGAREDASWIRPATSSLPVPVSPVSSTVERVGATRCASSTARAHRRRWRATIERAARGAPRARRAARSPRSTSRRVLHRARHAQLELSQLERLLEKVERAVAHRVAPRCRSCRTRSSAPRGARVTRPRRAQHGQPVGARQPQVGHARRRRARRRGRARRASAPSPASSSSTRPSARASARAIAAAQHGVVLDHEDARSRRGGRSLTAPPRAADATRKRAPPPGRSRATRREPPCATTIFCTSARPMPEPPARVVKNG